MSPSFRSFLPPLTPAPLVFSRLADSEPPSPSDAWWDGEISPPPSSVPAPPSEPIAVTLGAARWREVRISVIDGHTVRIQRGRRWLRRTYGDLGLQDKRTREPTEKWWMLLETCKGHGELGWDGFCEFNTAKQAVFVLNRQLKAAFGFKDNPFQKGNARKGGWQSKFIATPDFEEVER